MHFNTCKSLSPSCFSTNTALGGEYPFSWTLSPLGNSTRSGARPTCPPVFPPTSTTALEKPAPPHRKAHCALHISPRCGFLRVLSSVTPFRGSTYSPLQYSVFHLLPASHHKSTVLFVPQQSSSNQTQSSAYSFLQVRSCRHPVPPLAATIITYFWMLFFIWNFP